MDGFDGLNGVRDHRDAINEVDGVYDLVGEGCVDGEWGCLDGVDGLDGGGWGGSVDGWMPWMGWRGVDSGVDALARVPKWGG